MPQQATVDLALAERHRVAQGTLARRMLAEFARAWPVLRPRRLAASRPIWMEVTGEVIRTYALASASLAADYYESARELADIPGHFPVAIPEPASEEEIRKNLEWSTRRLWIPEPRAEQIEATRADAEGASTRLVMNGGRGAIAAAVAADRQATAWARVASPTACAFCALLSSRGSVYKENTVKFEAHNGCVLGVVLVDGPSAEVGFRRWYEGELVVIRTANGHELPITPNHPVLTDRGWVPADLLCEGDHVLSSFNAQASPFLVPDEQHVPAPIEDVWRALRVAGSVSVPVAAEDFHGDGTDCQVDVVRADGLLWDDFDVSRLKVLREDELALACVRESLFAVLRSPEEFFGGDIAAASGFVRLLGELGAFLGTELGHAHQASLNVVADGYSGLFQTPTDYLSADSVTLGERELAFTGQVGVHDVLRRQLLAVGARGDAAFSQLARENGGGHSSLGVDLAAGLAVEVEPNGALNGLGAGSIRPRRFDPPGLYSAVDGPSTHARLGRDLVERLTGRVERDRVVELRRSVWAGHVYNLQTAQGWYRANGIIVSNCHCQAVPVFAGQRYEPSEQVREWQRLYEQHAQGHSGDQLRLFRQAIEGRIPEQA